MTLTIPQDIPQASARFAERRPLRLAIRRGIMETCPHCGKGALYRSYLKVVDNCSACGEDLTHQRADDAPAYLTIFIVGHFIISGIVATEWFEPNAPFWIPAVIWSALTIVVSLLLLPRIKGGMIGLQWANRMHGFGGPDRNDPAST